MKRLPLLISFVMFILLSMSISYWGMQVFKPKVRAVAAPVNVVSFEPGVGQWGSVFGRNPQAEVAASNYQLKGVVAAGSLHDSAAILTADGKPAQTIGLGKELSPGVTLQEVHDTYILISEAGLIKRVDLPQASPSLPGNQVNPVNQVYVPPPIQRMPNSAPGAFMSPVLPAPVPPTSTSENSR
jgi:general secretion pathway protein C